jgi:hypothetical protein
MRAAGVVAIIISDNQLLQTRRREKAIASIARKRDAMRRIVISILKPFSFAVSRIGDLI